MFSYFIFHVSSIAVYPSCKDLRLELLEAVGLLLELMHESFVSVQVFAISSEWGILNEVIELLAGVLYELLDVAVNTCGLVQPMVKVVLNVADHVVIKVAPLLCGPLVKELATVLINGAVISVEVLVELNLMPPAVMAASCSCNHIVGGDDNLRTSLVWYVVLILILSVDRDTLSDQ